MVDLLNHNICDKHFMILFAILCPCETYKLSLSLSNLNDLEMEFSYELTHFPQHQWFKNKIF